MEMSDWFSQLMRANVDNRNPDVARFLHMNSQSSQHSLPSDFERGSSHASIATPTSVVDYRQKMESVFDTLKQAAKIAKGTRDFPDEQNLSLYVNLIEQIARSYVIIIDAPREIAYQLRKEMAEFFLESISVDSESVDYFSMITDICCRTSEALLSNEMDKLAHEVVLRSVIFLLNSTDYSPKFSERVVRSDKLMMALLALINRFAEDHMNGALTEPNIELLISINTMVYNVVRLSDADNIMRVRHFGFIEAVKPFLQTTRVDLKGIVILIIIFAASEEEAKECCSDEPTIKFLVERLTNALHSEDKRYDGFSSIELLEAIQKLAVIDENKKLLAKCGCLRLMKSRLEKGEDEELPYALSITTQLAFDEENAKWIGKELQDLLDSKFLNSENQNLRDRALKLKWIVDQKTGKSHKEMSAEASSVPKVPSEQQHIMISYQHDSKPIVRKLVDRLLKEKLKVWVDFNDICGHDDIIDAMAFAVENSSVVVVCVSLKYKDSEFCKMEAEYALEQKKRLVLLKMENWKADGWLGLLAGQKLYYDFSDSADFETTIGELLKSLHRSLRGDGDTPDGGNANQPMPHSPDEDFCQWDKSQVQDWCRRNCIPGEKCKNLTGNHLKTLKTRKDHAPDIYSRMVDEFQFSFEETVHFDTAVDALRTV